MYWFIVWAAVCAQPEPVTVCLTQLWEIYDYDYEYLDNVDDYGAAEVASWAAKIEVRSMLSNGMTGWTYVGFIHSTRVVRYDTGDDFTDVWWSTQAGTTGSAKTTEEAVRQIVEHRGRYRKPVGKIEIQWRSQ